MSEEAKAMLQEKLKSWERMVKLKNVWMGEAEKK